MKICRSRWLPLLLALAVLATLIPVGAFVFAADTVEPPEGYVAISDRQVTHTINGNSSNEAVYEGAGPVADAPAGSKFAFYFDTTAVAYDTTKGDKNNWAVHFNVWSNSANAWVAMKANGKYVYSRRYIRDGKLIEDVRTAGADPDDGWIGSIPVGAKGYMILDTGDISLGDITAFKLSPEWGWNENLYNKNVILGGCGYIPPQTPVEPPESSDPESSEPESSDPESSEPESIMDPPEGFVLVDKNGIDFFNNMSDSAIYYVLCD